MHMNTSSTPYSPSHTGSSRSSDSLSSTARDAVDSVKSKMGDALERGQTAISNASDTAGDMAETVNKQMKTFASELDAMAKSNPLGTIAGAVVIGVLIGFFARGRD
jgi:ElaB/YqjD/DUF883 family membrane-anchored ribosome-binding protein